MIRCVLRAGKPQVGQIPHHCGKCPNRWVISPSRPSSPAPSPSSQRIRTSSRSADNRLYVNYIFLVYQPLGSTVRPGESDPCDLGRTLGPRVRAFRRLSVACSGGSLRQAPGKKMPPPPLSPTPNAPRGGGGARRDPSRAPITKIEANPKSVAWITVLSRGAPRGPYVAPAAPTGATRQDQSLTAVAPISMGPTSTPPAMRRYTGATRTTTAPTGTWM